MSRQASSPKLDLKLNLSPPRAPEVDSPEKMSVSSSDMMSPESSCVSAEMSMEEQSSPEEISMMLVGCTRCLMYVMLSQVNPKCPKCKSTVLLDFLNEENTIKAKN